MKDSSVSRSRLVSGFTGRDCRWNFFFYINKRLPLCLAGSASWLSDCLDTSHRRSTEECGFTDVAFFVRSTAALGCTLAYSSMLTHLCMSECCVLPDARVGIFLCGGGVLLPSVYVTKEAAKLPLQQRGEVSADEMWNKDDLHPHPHHLHQPPLVASPSPGIAWAGEGEWHHLYLMWPEPAVGRPV